MLAPADKMERAALATLSAIKTYVMSGFFMPTGLAKGLGRKIGDIETEVLWLKEHGHVALADCGTKMYVTHKGWMVP